MGPALVTDSNSQLPPVLQERFDVRVVSIPVVVDGIEYLEGETLDADGFYALFTNGTPEVSTSQPAPGAFVQAYQACIDDGHDEIISVHVGAQWSGTLNSARIAADMVDATVHLVDTGTLSFGVSCCVWRAAETLQNGGSVEAAISAATALAGELHSVTALGAADLLKGSGRVDFETSATGVDVYLASPDGSFVSVGAGASVDEVCALMASTMHRDGAEISVALGIADESAMPYYDGLEALLGEREDVLEVVRYRIGPSVGAFTGLGTAGGFWW